MLALIAVLSLARSAVAEPAWFALGQPNGIGNAKRVAEPAWFAQPNGGRDFRDWGRETLELIQKNYWLPKRFMYSEEAGGKQPAYNWSIGVLMRAFNASHWGGEFGSRQLQLLEGSHIYWNDAGPVPGYSVLPWPSPKDRYYDDNEWMALGLLEGRYAWGGEGYLEQAKKTFAFVQSGWDDKLGGGVYWRENEKSSKNTCSNGPAIDAAIELYSMTPDKKYLDFAVADYDWTREHLRDPSDGLYFDNISLAGRVEKTKWSYNSALMLKSAVGLYRITKQRRYGEDAVEMLKSSVKRWIAPDGAFKDDGRFGFLLMDAWIDAGHFSAGGPDVLAVIDKALRIVHDRCRDADGEYGARWDQAPPAAGWPQPMLIDQAAVACAYLELYRATFMRNSVPWVEFPPIQDSSRHAWYDEGRTFAAMRPMLPEARRLAGLLEDVYNAVYDRPWSERTDEKERLIVSNLLACASTNDVQDCADAAFELAWRHGMSCEFILGWLHSLAFDVPAYGPRWHTQGGKLVLSPHKIGDLRAVVFTGDHPTPYIVRGSVREAKRRDLTPYLGQIGRQ